MASDNNDDRGAPRERFTPSIEAVEEVQGYSGISLRLSMDGLPGGAAASLRTRLQWFN